MLGDGVVVGVRSKSSSSQRFAYSALVSVSSVVNVFDDTITNVSAGSRSCVFSYTSVGSMFEMKRMVSERSA